MERNNKILKQLIMDLKINNSETDKLFGQLSNDYKNKKQIDLNEQKLLVEKLIKASNGKKITVEKDLEIIITEKKHTSANSGFAEWQGQ